MNVPSYFLTMENVQAQKDARFIVCAFDMADLDSIQPSWAAALAAATAAAGPAGFTRAILINNSGSLGDMSSCADLPSLSSLRAAMDANITGVMWMTSLFLKWMQSAAGPVSTGEPSLIINVSSLAAIKPFPTQLTYCVGKAARDMLHAGLAEELQQAQEAGRLRCAVKTLNYAPGPLDTDMQSELRDSSTLLPSTRTFFIQMKAEGTLVMPTQSAMKCARLVQANRFTSGAHIDYYEEEP